MIKPWLFVGAAETLLGVAAQAEFLPESMLGIFLQLPLVAVVIWLQLQNQRWYTQMMTSERQSIKEIYESEIRTFKELYESEIRTFKELHETERVSFQETLASLKEIYEGQQAFLGALLSQIDGKQNKMVDQVELLTQQVALFRGTLSEVTKIDDVVDRLLDKIQK